MIGALLLASTFLILLFLAIVVLIVYFKKYVIERDKAWEQKTDEMKNEIKELKELFQHEVTDVLINFKKLLK